MGDIESQLTGLLNDLAMGAGSPGRLPGSVRRRIRLRKIVAASLVAVVAVGVGFGIGFGAGHSPFSNKTQPARRGGSSIEPSRQSATYTDHELGWSWAYPSNWHLQTFSGKIGRGFLGGALIANVNRSFHHPDFCSGCISFWDMHGTPKDLVVIEFACLTVGLASVNSSTPDTAFPLSLTDFKRSSFVSYGAPEPHLWMPLRIHGRQGGWGAYVWLGDQVSAKEKRVASQIVSSITKPSSGCT